MRRIRMLAGLTTLLVVAGGAPGCKKKQEDEGKGEAKGAMAAMADPGAMDRPARDARREAKKAPPPRANKDEVPEGIISLAKGTVEIRRAGLEGFEKVAKDDKVFAEDAVRVGADGEATLAMWDNSSVQLAPESAVTVNSSEDIKAPAPSVTVMAGAVAFDVAERDQGQGPFSVYTPSSVAHVQGTVLSVGVGLSGASRVGVSEGKVEVVPVAKLDAKPLALPAGKVVEVPFGKPPASPAAYQPDQWDDWLEREDARAIKQADRFATVHAERVDKLVAMDEKLEPIDEKLDKQAETLEKKVATAAKNKEVKVYSVAQPKLQANVDLQESVLQQRRFLGSRAAAHAYLLALMRARAEAGVYKLDPKVLEKIAKRQERVMKRVDRRRLRRARRVQPRRRRIRRLRRHYLLHHPSGRQLAKKLDVEVPSFYRKRKLKPQRRRRVRRRARIAGYDGPVYHRPRYRGRVRKIKRARRRAHRAARRLGPGPDRTWYRDKQWRKRRKKRMKRRNKHQRRFRKAVIKQRRKRWAKRPKVRMRRRGRRRGGRRARGMGVRGMGVRGMGVRGMGVRGMGIRMRERDGMRVLRGRGMGERGMGVRRGMRMRRVDRRGMGVRRGMRKRRGMRERRRNRRGMGVRRGMRERRRNRRGMRMRRRKAADQN